MVSIAIKNNLKRKILEAYYIKIRQPLSNAQMNNDVLNLCKNGVIIDLFAFIPHLFVSIVLNFHK